MESVEVSPLRRFVVAKRCISSIFDHLLEFTRDGSQFVQEACERSDLGPVAEPEHSLQLNNCYSKLANIREVVVRRTMKVAFFGRTSNGKSTVINAMLRDRVLPSGIGHTTNCFLSVEGTDTEEGYLTTEGSEDKLSVQTVHQLAHALHMDPTLDSGSLVRVFWPKSRCSLLRDDLVLMDSPGTDVTVELDGWIDRFCLDADVFVLVGNAESTLMNTEKLFFHKVGERISKPNIFILHNRWDASVTEPEYIQEVRKQHMDRCISFLSEELKVLSSDEAPQRIFFVSAKEVLSSRIHRAQGMPESGGALAEGFHERLREFQMFERTFEEFISQSAVRTKFEQHTLRAWTIAESIKTVMDTINIRSADRKISLLEEREEQRDRLDFVRGQINRLSDSLKESIRILTEETAAKVGAALLDQIRTLPVLVEEFRSDFNPTPETLELYKSKLVQHVEERLVALLSARCSACVLRDVRQAQRHMTDSVRPLLSASVQQLLASSSSSSSPSSCFQLTYDLNMAAICADFKENIHFQFSLGWSALVSRFIGAANVRRALTTPPTQSCQFKEEVLVSVTSRASMAVLVVGGVICRAVGWRVVALSLSLYSLLYLYEKLSWTSARQERALKLQFVEHASKGLRAVAAVTSSSCKQQVHKELWSTLSRLTQRVDLSEAELEASVRQLSLNIQALEGIQRSSKNFRNRATELQTQLDAFTVQYLHQH